MDRLDAWSQIVTYTALVLLAIGVTMGFFLACLGLALAIAWFSCPSLERVKQ